MPSDIVTVVHQQVTHDPFLPQRQSIPMIAFGLPSDVNLDKKSIFSSGLLQTDTYIIT